MKNFETLEVGKTYKNRQGELVKIIGSVDCHSSTTMFYSSDDEHGYSETGDFSTGEFNHLDLVELVDDQQVAPPLGVMPGKFFKHEIRLLNVHRVKTLLEASIRYINDGRIIPQEWIDEINEINKDLS